MKVTLWREEVVHKRPGPEKRMEARSMFGRRVDDGGGGVISTSVYRG